MRAVILAAGRGRRMGTYTDDRPKCLIPLDGTTLLDRHRDALAAAGVDEIAIVTGYRADALSGLLTRDFHAPRWAETNMVVSLTTAHEWLRTTACVVVYGDIFYTAETVRSLIAAPGELAIAYDPHWLALWSRRFADPLCDAEAFRLRSDATVSEIGGRAASTQEIQGQYMGLLRFTPAVWTRVEQHLAALAPTARDQLDMTSLLGELIGSGEQILAVARQGPWGELDQPSDLALYNAPSAAAAAAASGRRYEGLT